MSYRNIVGSVSHGTLRPEDLIPTFIDTASELLHSVGCPLTPEENGDANAMLGEIERRMESAGYFESEDALYDLEYLQDLLDSMAPTYLYFGAHPGDGSDFGFWPILETIEEDRESGELDSGGELPTDSTASGLFLQVSDHGNMELYRWDGGGWVSLWSYV